MINGTRILPGLLASILIATATEPPPPLELPNWSRPTGSAPSPFSIDPSGRRVRIYGRGDQLPRVYFEELLPALFERSLEFEELSLDHGRLEWIFTGDRGGFTIVIDGSRVELAKRYYDSVGFAEQKGDTPERHPEWSAPAATAGYQGKLRALSVTVDHRLGVAVALNGTRLIHQICPVDVNRHQLRLTGANAAAVGHLLSAEAQECRVQVDPAVRHQAMLGFGGIATPTAYAMLSPAGKRRWWELICEYNLLIQREYPNGTRLNERMDNWDRLADATPHNYNDNFPNGEISDFQYIRTLRRLGGSVWFEFWDLPPWAEGNPPRYAEAMVIYCRTARDRTGAPPEIVGIQNEKTQTPEMYARMTLTLRRELDRAGFQAVRIHMSDAGGLRGGISRAEIFAGNRDVWAAIDYSATHMYDYQKTLTDPDQFDASLAQFKQLTADRPFLSTELCVNNPAYQWPSYRLALSMGQLYHKNLVICDAVAICYCWTLLNVVQPSYGWTRTLFVPETARGSQPRPSSHQLRVFGAYSRRIREGMIRVEAKSSSADLLTVAFAGERGEATAVLANRAARPQRVHLAWPAARLTDAELVDPYSENVAMAAPQPVGGVIEVTVAPGAIVTLSNVGLRTVPAGALEPEPPGRE